MEKYIEIFLLNLKKNYLCAIVLIAPNINIYIIVGFGKPTLIAHTSPIYSIYW
jgi:hypothetical protein